LTQERKRGSKSGGTPTDANEENVPSSLPQPLSSAGESAPSMFSSPSASQFNASVLPAPLSIEYIEALERYVPGAAKRALALTEKEQQHRHVMDYKDINNMRLLMGIMSLTLAGLIGGAIALGLNGQAFSVAAMLGGPVVGGVLGLGSGRLRARRGRRI